MSEKTLLFLFLENITGQKLRDKTQDQNKKKLIAKQRENCLSCLGKRRWRKGGNYEYLFIFI